MKTSSAVNFHRAGKRKCHRCKAVFHKEKGPGPILCDRCKTHCVRCDSTLTAENYTLSQSRKGVKYCDPCHRQVGEMYRDKENKEVKKIRTKEWALLKRYGVTLNEYDAILSNQKGACWICEKVPTGNKLAVDHKHVLNDKKQNPRETRTRIRGLLCWSCNTSLQKFRDNPELLRKAAEYLETWPAQKVLNEVSILPK